MAHLQQQILDALKAALLNATDAQDRVFVDRVDPLSDKQMPAIAIRESDNGETVVAVGVSKLEERLLEVEVHCLVTQCATAPADARALGLAVEKIIHPSAALRALAKAGRRIVSSRLGVMGEGERLFAVRVQTWQFSYYLNPAAPDVVA